MENRLWQHSLKVCYTLLKLLKNDQEFSNERLWIINTNFIINEISHETLEGLLQQAPALHTTTTIFVDADFTTETEGVHTKFVLHYSEKLEYPQLLIFNTNIDPATVAETHLLRVSDAIEIVTPAYFEQMMANYNN